MSDYTIGGLPLHPLLVHAVVVLVPLTALAVVLHAAWPAAGRRLGFVTPLAGLALVVLVPITVTAGEHLLAVVGPLPGVNTHMMFGRMLLPWVIALFVVGLVEWLWFGPIGKRVKAPRWLRIALRAVLIAAAAVVAGGSIVLIVLIGESGARAVWGSLFGG